SPDGAQAVRDVLPGGRRSREDAPGDLASIRTALSRAFHRRDRTRAARRARPDRRRGQPCRAAALELAPELEPLRAVPAIVARRGFHSAGQRCGTHDLAGYLAQVNALKRLFARLAAAD